MTTRNPDPETGRVNLFDPELSSDPQPLYAELRSKCPVARSTFFDSPIMSRYEDVTWGLRHPEIFSSAMDSASCWRSSPRNLGSWPARQGIP